MGFWVTATARVFRSRKMLPSFPYLPQPSQRILLGRGLRGTRGRKSQNILDDGPGRARISHVVSVICRAHSGHLVVTCWQKRFLCGIIPLRKPFGWKRSWKPIWAAKNLADFGNVSSLTIRSYTAPCGCSSAVERYLAKVNVESSILFTRY